MRWGTRREIVNDNTTPVPLSNLAREGYLTQAQPVLEVCPNKLVYEQNTGTKKLSFHLDC